MFVFLLKLFGQPTLTMVGATREVSILARRLCRLNMTNGMIASVVWKHSF